MLNVSVFSGKLIRRPELRKDSRGNDLVHFCVRRPDGDIIPCFSTGNNAKHISKMDSGTELLWVAHIVSRNDPDDRFDRVKFHVNSWDILRACETDSVITAAHR